MTRTDLISVVKTHFPEALGCMLTGSQKANISFDSLFSDVDIVVFDMASSDVYTREIVNDRIRIDATIVPICDIHNVLNNEKLDATTTLLRMIAEGMILFDTASITENIQGTAKDLLSTPNVSANTEFNKLNQSLSKISTYLNRDVTQSETFVILCEIVTILSSMEVITLTHSTAAHLRKSKLLCENKPAFVSQLRQLFGSVNQNNDLTPVFDFIKTYQSGNVESIPGKESSWIIIDMKVENDMPLLHFKKMILPGIASNTILNTAYRSVFISPTKYHKLYRNNICLCFELAEGSDRSGVIHKLRNSVNGVYNRLVTYELLPFTEEYLNGLLDTLKKFRVTMSEIALTLIEKPDYFYETLAVAVSLCRFLLKKLKISNPDLAQLNDMLIQTWIFTKTEQKENSYKSLKQIQNQKLDAIKQYYSKNERTILASIAGIESYTQISYAKAIIEEITDNRHFDQLSKFMPAGFLDYLLIEDPKSAKGYLAIVNEILTMLSLKDDAKAVGIFLVSELELNK